VVVTKPPTSDGTVKPLEGSTTLIPGIGWAGYNAWAQEMNGVEAKLAADWKKAGRDIEGNIGQFHKELFDKGADLLRQRLLAAGAGVGSTMMTNFENVINFVGGWQDATERFNFLYTFAAMIYADIHGFANNDPGSTMIYKLMEHLGAIALNGMGSKTGSGQQKAKEEMFKIVHDEHYWSPAAIRERDSIMTRILFTLLVIPGILDSVAQLILQKDWITGKSLTQLDNLLLVAGLALVVVGKMVVVMKASKGLANAAKAEGAVASKSGSFISCLKNSFSAKTKVVTKTTLAAIATLTVGNSVLAFNEQSKTENTQKITATIHHTDLEIVKLTLVTSEGNREILETTREHPFYVITETQASANGKWVNAEKLERGNKLKRARGFYGTVKSVEIERKTQEMYNLTVDKAHTYFVGDGQWLVHNANCIDYGTLDSQGRPQGVTATIDTINPPGTPGGGTPANPGIRPPDFPAAGTGTHPFARGHLLASMLGGSGDEAANLVTIFQSMNNSAMKRLEYMMRDAVRAGETLTINITPIYNGTSGIPRGINVVATGNRGFNINQTILNVPQR
jgi:hypothetical protein